MIRLSGVGDVIAHYATRMDLSYVLLACDHCICSHCPRLGHGCYDYGGRLNGLDYWRRELTSLPPGLVLLAIGFGSITLSWMNDSGFWVVQKLSGLTEKEMLKTWSVLLTLISLVGVALSFAGATFFLFATFSLL